MISKVTKMILRAESDPAHLPCWAENPEEAFAVARVGSFLEASFLAAICHIVIQIFLRWRPYRYFFYMMTISIKSQYIKVMIQHMTRITITTKKYAVPIFIVCLFIQLISNSFWGHMYYKFVSGTVVTTSVLNL